MGQVEPMGWTIFFITIIIKLSRKKYKYKYIKKKLKDLYQCNSLKAKNTND